jgi:hypothetical protein
MPAVSGIYCRPRSVNFCQSISNLSGDSVHFNNTKKSVVFSAFNVDCFVLYKEHLALPPFALIEIHSAHPTQHNPPFSFIQLIYTQGQTVIIWVCSFYGYSITQTLP